MFTGAKKEKTMFNWLMKLLKIDKETKELEAEHKLLSKTIQQVHVLLDEGTLYLSLDRDNDIKSEYMWGNYWHILYVHPVERGKLYGEEIKLADEYGYRPAAITRPYLRKRILSKLLVMLEEQEKKESTKTNIIVNILDKMDREE